VLHVCFVFPVVFIAELYNSFENISKSWTVVTAREKASETQKGTPQ